MPGDRWREEDHHRRSGRRDRSSPSLTPLRSRSRSPRRDNSRRDDRRQDRHRESDARRTEGRARTSRSSAAVLPFNAEPLSKYDYRKYESMFALYLDIQKQIVLDEIPEKEARGRWKSFVGKWNRGELAEGWYDPSTFAKSQQSLQEPTSPLASPLQPPRPSNPSDNRQAIQVDRRDVEDDDEDDYGPALPSKFSSSGYQRRGVAVPSIQDLELRREQAQEERDAARDDLKQERRDYRKQEQAKLDDLAPKAEAGTKERQLEKRREAAAANRAFASAKTDAGGAMEVGDEDLMGGADGIDEYRKMKKETERKKNEREIRRDEVLRARQAETEERVRAYRDKEEKTMAGLIALAKQKYG